MITSFSEKGDMCMRLINLLKVVRMSTYTVIVPVLLLCSPLISFCAETDKPAKSRSSPADIALSAVADGKIAYKLTTPDELKALLGPAENEAVRNDGGMEILELMYPDVQATFGRMRRYSTPPTLLWISVKGKGFDIGQERQIVMRNKDDLRKFDAFWGFANVSLAKVDLREHLQLLETMPFDSQTVWPEADKMPDAFDPTALLEDGKNPGLGVRALHKQGVDGRGVGIAIIDQPLLKDHIEYADRIVQYEAVGVQGVPVQMHGSPVSSIAVGKTCGIAPGASLYYFAVPMWKPENKPYCDIIDKLIKLNANPNTTEKVKVVSISTGMFSQQANFERWQEALKKADQNGILIVTCAQDSVQYGMLARIPGKIRMTLPAIGAEYMVSGPAPFWSRRATERRPAT